MPATKCYTNTDIVYQLTVAEFQALAQYAVSPKKNCASVIFLNNSVKH